MRQTISDIASLIQGDLVGDGMKVIEGIAPFDDADGTSITILANVRHSFRLDTTKAGAVIVPLDIKKAPIPIIRVASPEHALVTLLTTYIPPHTPAEPGIHPTASIHSTAVISAHVSIGPRVTIGAHTVVDEHVCIGSGSSIGEYTRLGAGVWLYPNVTLYDQVCLGKNVIIHSGTVVGSDGFGYVQGDQGALKIPQVGGVDIGDDVEIGANSTIDRATLGRTRIGRGTKIDNLVQIGHNVIIGDHVTICAQVGIAGSTIIDDGALIAGQAGLADHIHVGVGARIGGQAGVTKSIPAGATVSGYPARPHSHARRIEALVNRLPDLMQRIQDLEQRLNALKKTE